MEQGASCSCLQRDAHVWLLTPGTFTLTSVCGPGTGGAATSTCTPPPPAGLMLTLVVTFWGGVVGGLGGLHGIQTIIANISRGHVARTGNSQGWHLPRV